MNLLTPLRVTDVSPQQQERLLQQAANTLYDELGAKTWKNRYFSKEQMAKASPQERAVMEQLNKMAGEAKKKAKKFAEENKKARASQEPARANPLLKMAGL